MNEKELRCEMVRRGYSISTLADATGIGRKAMYTKLSGKSDFKQSEIKKISEVLQLTGSQILNIFFVA